MILMILRARLRRAAVGALGVALVAGWFDPIAGTDRRVARADEDPLPPRVASAAPALEPGAPPARPFPPRGSGRPTRRRAPRGDRWLVARDRRDRAGPGRLRRDQPGDPPRLALAPGHCRRHAPGGRPHQPLAPAYGPSPERRRPRPDRRHGPPGRTVAARRADRSRRPPATRPAPRRGSRRRRQRPRPSHGRRRRAAPEAWS